MDEHKPKDSFKKKVLFLNVKKATIKLGPN